MRQSEAGKPLKRLSEGELRKLLHLAVRPLMTELYQRGVVHVVLDPAVDDEPISITLSSVEKSASLPH